MRITDEMIRNIEEDMEAIDPDGARREYERIERWNEYQRRYKLGMRKRPDDDVVVVCDNKKNIEA